MLNSSVYKIIIFDLDETLVKGRTIDVLAEKYNFTDLLKDLRSKWIKNEIREYDISIELAKQFEGKTYSDIENVIKSVPLREHAVNIFNEIEKRGLKRAITSQAFSPIATYYNQFLRADYLLSLKLEEKEGIYTGKIKIGDLYNPDCELGHAICKENVLKKIAKLEKLKFNEMIAVGNGRGDICMLRYLKRHGGLPIGFGRREEIKPFIKIEIKNLSEILKFIPSTLHKKN